MSLYSTTFEGSTSVSTFFDQLIGGGSHGAVGNYSTDPSNFASTDGGAAHIYGYCDGGYCYTGVNQNGYGLSGCFSISTSTELYFRAYLYDDTSNLGAGQSGQILTFFSSSGGGYIARLELVAGALRAVRDSGSGSNITLATSANAYPTDAWHLVEIHLKCATDSSGIFDCTVDGSSTYGFTFSGQTNHDSNGCLAVQLQNHSSLKQAEFWDNVTVNAAADGAPGAVPCGEGGYWGIRA